MYTRTKKTLTYSVLERPVCIRRPAASTDVNASANVTMVVFIVLLCLFFFMFVEYFLVFFFFCLQYYFLLPPFWNKYLSIPLVKAKRSKKIDTLFHIHITINFSEHTTRNTPIALQYFNINHVSRTN